MDVCESTQGSVSVLNVAVWLAHRTSQLGQLAQAYLICAALPHSCTTPIWIIRWQVWGLVRVCEQCHKLREVYWKALVEVARLECLKSSLDAGAPLEEVHSLDAQIELADQARRAARDALQTHRIEKGHS